MQVQRMTPEQVNQQLVAHYGQMLKKDTEYLQKIGNAWGMV